MPPFSILMSMNQNTKIALHSLFISLGVVLGFSLAHLPNIELVTATIFISGYLLGWRSGLMIGLLTEAIYSMLSPYGLASIPIFLGQTLAMGLTGACGGWMAVLAPLKGWLSFIKTGIAGLLLSIHFALLTTLGYVFFAGITREVILTSIITGLGFYITHFISNFLIFTLLVPGVILSLKKLMKAD